MDRALAVALMTLVASRENGSHWRGVTRSMSTGRSNTILVSTIVLLLGVPGAVRAQTVCPTPWRLEEVVRIGSLESADLVTRVTDLALGPDSALYVAQAQVPAVTVFSLDGQVLRRIGRAGQGPGDIQLLVTGVGWIGNTLWIADFGRIQLFTTDERVPERVIQFNLPMPNEGSRLTPGRLLADGSLIGARGVTDWRTWLSQGAGRGLALRRLSPSGEVLDTIATIDWSDNAVEYERDPGRLWPAIHPLKELPPIGLQEFLTALRPDGSAIVQIGRVDDSGTPPTFDILAISISGDTLVQRAVEYEPREVTDGTIWLLREMREDRVDVWEIYDSAGTLEGTVEIGQGRGSLKPWTPRLAVVVANRDEIWGTTFDEFEVPYIHRFRVDRTCAR